MTTKLGRSAAALALSVGAVTATLSGAAPASAAPAPAPAGASVSAGCWVDHLRFLHCGSYGTGNVRVQPRLNASIVGTISASAERTFICFKYGDKHPGGNTVWYGTYADNGQFGWTAASNVATNVDPFPGIADCN